MKTRHLHTHARSAASLLAVLAALAALWAVPVVAYPAQSAGSGSGLGSGSGDDPGAETATEAGSGAETAPEIPEVDVPAEPLLTTTLQGWLDSRFTGAYARVTGLLPSTDVPQLQNLTEANLQLRMRWRDKAQVYGDVSWVYARGGYYVDNDGTGQRTSIPNHDVASMRPGAFVSELYGLWQPTERWSLTLGKKRVVWGPGLAWNPTDLLNPPKDPTDPTQQRAGSWLARVEGQYDLFSVSFVGAAKTTRQYGGIPSGLIWYPDNQPALAYDAAGQRVQDGRDGEPHFALAARAYTLINNSDVQVFGYLTHLYNDAFRYQPRFGASFSRVFGDAIELHAEVLGQQGSSRVYFDGSCTQSLTAALGCVGSGKAVAANTQLDSAALRWKALFGARYQFGEAASVSAEYFLNTEGYTAREFGALAGALRLRQQAALQGMSIPAGALGSFGQQQSDPGTPQKFAFEPLRRHYLFLTYLHPQLADDFTINTVVIVGLEDLSGQLAPQLIWSAQQWLNLSVGAFVTLPGPSQLRTQVGNVRVSEYGLQPALGRVFAAVRLFF